MSTSDTLIVFGPFLLMAFIAMVCFGVVHYNDAKGN